MTAFVGDGVRAERASKPAGAVLRSALGELEMECWVGTLTVGGFPPAARCVQATAARAALLDTRRSCKCAGVRIELA